MSIMMKAASNIAIPLLSLYAYFARPKASVSCEQVLPAQIKVARATIDLISELNDNLSLSRISSERVSLINQKEINKVPASFTNTSLKIAGWLDRKFGWIFNRTVELRFKSKSGSKSFKVTVMKDSYNKLIESKLGTTAQSANGVVQRNRGVLYDDLKNTKGKTPLELGSKLVEMYTPAQTQAPASRLSGSPTITIASPATVKRVNDKLQAGLKQAEANKQTWASWGQAALVAGVAAISFAAVNGLPL